MKYFISILFVLLTLFSFSQAGDCPGYCLQNSGTFTATAGLVAELNTTNRGCLTANEASSSFWFQICFNSAGRFHFSINPNGNRNDFDWAIWNAETCPPSGAPVRCSYAGVANGGPCETCDYTGLGTNPNNGVLATDVSESSTGDGWLAPLTVSSGECYTLNINNFKNGSSVFTIDLTGTTAGITISSACTILPVELLNFRVEGKSDHNFLSWQTASEKNNDYFIVERSGDAINWKELDRVDGSGTTHEIQSYFFKDYDLLNPKDYYRLKQTDYNGDFNYSKIIVSEKLVNAKIIKIISLNGVEVDTTYRGFVIECYNDGTFRKKIKH
jgi:hypothetical protein